LQVALTTSQVTPKDQSYMIPTPEAAVQVSDYESLYPAVFKQRKGFIRHTGTLEDLQYMQSKYVADRSDLQFLNISDLGSSSSLLRIFEHVIECFEEGANKFSEGIVSIDTSLDRIRNDDKLNALLVKETDEALLETWLAYWKSKRRDNQCSLVASLKHEDVGKIGSDPYVCFRRRELKQPRKTRRSDAQVMEKIKKIHYDLDTVRVMLLAGIKREKLKKESFLLECGAFDKYMILRSWQQEYGIERPPTLPSFKVFHHQIPYIANPADEAAKKNPSTTRKRPSRRISEEVSGTEDDEDSFASTGPMADLVKISIPPAAIKSVRFSRPYYPFEVVKQIQKDVESLLQPQENYRDFTADLGIMELAYRQKAHNFRTNIAEKLEMVRNRHARDENVLVLRKGRCGRLLYTSDSAGSHRDLSFVDRLYKPEAGSHLRSIQARDCAHLNNAFVGNYNQHYIQCTAGLTQPTSLPSWISATSGLLNSKTTAKGSTSPNKKKRPNTANSEETTTTTSTTEEAHKKIRTGSTTSTEATVTNLTSSPQFTVKVKAKLDPSSSSSLSTESGNDSDNEGGSDQLTIAPTKKASNAARFTPTGLQKESRIASE
jgi:hypothetical protein